MVIIHDGRTYFDRVILEWVGFDRFWIKNRLILINHSIFSFLGLWPFRQPVGRTADSSIAQAVATTSSTDTSLAALLSLWGEIVWRAAPEAAAEVALRYSCALSAEVAPPTAAQSALTHFWNFSCEIYIYKIFNVVFYFNYNLDKLPININTFCLDSEPTTEDISYWIFK